MVQNEPSRLEHMVSALHDFLSSLLRLPLFLILPSSLSLHLPQTPRIHLLILRTLPFTSSTPVPCITFFSLSPLVLVLFLPLFLPDISHFPHPSTSTASSLYCSFSSPSILSFTLRVVDRITSAIKSVVV